MLYAAEAYAAPKTRQPKMPTEQQFLQRQLHALNPERKTSSLPLTNSAPNLPAGNQELFVFQKVAGDWKIARYCFSATNPPTVQ
jgi:hypothetical protein